MDTIKANRITDHQQIEVGRHYWLKSKAFGSIDIEQCLLNGGTTYKRLGQQWVQTPFDNDHPYPNYLFSNWEIYGPVPHLDTDDTIEILTGSECDS